ncbi:HNH endonuclease [Micromonospora chersina]
MINVAEENVAVESSAMGRAWSLLTIDDDDRQFGGNSGYRDILGSRYAWDNTVPHHASVRPGDLAVLRDRNFVLGVGWIDEIHTETQTKVRRRCPECRNTSFKPRKQAAPRYKCSPCQATFDLPLEESIDVTVYVGDYTRTWRSTRDLRVTELTPAYLSRSQQHSIRELDSDLAMHLFSGSVDPSLQWWIASTDPQIPGGHRSTLGRYRIGQAKFRQVLRQRFGDRCLITGPQPAAAIEAAHLYRYRNAGEHDVQGGILLRRDLHSLFDQFLLAVDPAGWIVRLAPSLLPFPELALLDGRVLAIPADVRPRPDYLEAHLAWALDLWSSKGLRV